VKEGRIMRRIVCGACLVIVCLFICLPAVLAQQALGPRIVIKERFFDAKEVKEGEVIEHAFTVYNKGDEVLQIRKVSPG
jgi:hypothetical protein